MRSVAVLLPAVLLAQDSAKSVRSVPVVRRVALVIGNSNYRHVPAVPPASADADDIAAALQRLGFDVVIRKNLENDKAIQEINGFARTRVKPGDLALLYYSGHGGQVGEENFLLPVDYQPPSDEDLVETRAVRMSRARDALERTGARVRILVFDACRNSPVTTSKTAGSGLRALEGRHEGTLIAFASAHNQVARYEGSQRNSLYTAELLAALSQPREHVKGLFEQVQTRVFERTGQKQAPYLYGFLSGPVYLGEPPAAFAPAPLRTNLDPAVEAWNAIKNTGNAAVLLQFAAEFPRHDLSRAARLKARSLSMAAEPLARKPVSATRTDTQRGPEGAIWIWPGSFAMGCEAADKECAPNESPAREISIVAGFWMKETEVTQGEFMRVMRTNPSHFRGPNRPVEQVTWEEAAEYCRRENGRLPSAKEWEYAAKARSSGPRYGELANIAWGQSNAGFETHDVRQLAPNGWGLYDMIGNVWEFTSDDFNASSKEVRGGSWFNGSSSLRASVRFWNGPEIRFNAVGFRCAWDH